MKSFSPERTSSCSALVPLHCLVFGPHTFISEPEKYKTLTSRTLLNKCLLSFMSFTIFDSLSFISFQPGADLCRPSASPQAARSVQRFTMFSCVPHFSSRIIRKLLFFPFPNRLSFVFVFCPSLL